MTKKITQFELEAGRMTRFAGHTLATTFGFVLLLLVSLLLTGLVWLMSGFAMFVELAHALHVVEQILFYGDICLFTVTFGLGLVELLSEKISETFSAIKSHWK